MQVEVLEEIESPNIKKLENLETRTEGLEVVCHEKELKLDSVLDVSGKTLDFPFTEGKRETAKDLYFYKNEFNLIPSLVGKSFKGLKTFKFFSNEMNLFHGEFGNLVDLECLQVKVAEPGVNGLELSKLGNLRELELSRSPPRPSAYPLLSQIAGLKRLTRLSVCYFSIRYLPPEIGCLENLEYLDLSFNKLRSLPNEITSLSLLISLKVANNKLMDLPLRLSCLQRLENLDISNNRLTSIDCLKLEAMCSLRLLDLQHNLLNRCQVPEWVNCKTEGNIGNPFNDEASDMDFCESDIQEIHGSVVQKSPFSGFAHINHQLAARRTNGWKRWNNSRKRDQEEQLNSYRKLTVHVHIEGSGFSDDPAEKSFTITPGDGHSDENLVPETEIDVNSSVEPVNMDSSFDMESFNECSSAPTTPDVIYKVVESDISVSNLTADSLAVEGGQGSSSSESSGGVLKSKRHPEKDLKNPKPSKNRKPTNDASCLSSQYSERSFCGVDDYLPDGFYDAGRDRPFMPLHSYESNLNDNRREVILLDRELDEKLDASLLCARALLSQFKKMNSAVRKHREEALDDLQIAYLLAFYVSDHFGGRDRSVIIERNRISVSGSVDMKPFVCTCTAGITTDTAKANKVSVEHAGGVCIPDLCEKTLKSVKRRRKSVIVPIGDVQFGICRHRAVLMKYLCDRMEPRIPCELVRGYLDFSPHAWNVIVIKKGEMLARMIVDACHPHDIRDERDPEYFCRYIPLSRVCAPVLGDNVSIAESSFPSLDMCDELMKLESTSLMRCNVGGQDAVMKVKTIEISGTSVEEMRDFEYHCLGEVRLLSVLKHSCIVTYYGHQIWSEWSGKEDENSGTRTLRSAILMEDIKGGSVMRYVAKLRADGKKHVAPELALSIARDVAFALTELHSRHVIHRDIKSDNILIDLEKKKQDGTPTVKICDFDRAIPLKSYLHSCCMAHVGVHPPDFCVGTPRWMAPEVFCAMQQRKYYGLEVDIWSFGCFLLELLTLDVPYNGFLDSDIHKFLEAGERPSLTEELEEMAKFDDTMESESDDILRFLAKLFHQCTEKDPSDRLSSERLYNLLADRAAELRT